MIKSQLIKKYYCQADKLNFSNPTYLAQVKKVLLGFLIEDLGKRGDVTSDLLITTNRQVRAVVFAKEAGVVAGIAEVEWLIKHLGLKVTKLKKDGDKIKVGEKIIIIKAGIKDILKIERAILNIMQRMSGIATTTAKIVRSSGKKVLICPTRKTQWGWLDKKAVVAGGGGTHRLGLYDFILIKDNHLRFLDNNIEDRLPAIKKSKLFWEIEVKDLDEALWAASLGPGAIMLDNFSPETAKSVVAQLKDYYPEIIIELSGGINPANIVGYAKCGADVISLGALTHSVKALDISLDVI